MSAEEARNQRVSRKLTLQDVSKKMGISISYLADLEKGNRQWSHELEAAFKKAIK